MQPSSTCCTYPAAGLLGCVPAAASSCPACLTHPPRLSHPLPRSPTPAPAAEGDYKHKIVQRGAVPPLIDMLGNEDTQLREMAAFALGRLAQNSDNQAGIVAQGGLPPLLDLLETCQSNLQVGAGLWAERRCGGCEAAQQMAVVAGWEVGIAEL